MAISLPRLRGRDVARDVGRYRRVRDNRLKKVIMEEADIEKPVGLCDLPPEICNKIIEDLHIKDAACLSRTCKKASSSYSTFVADRVGPMPLFHDVATLNLPAFKRHLNIFQRQNRCAKLDFDDDDSARWSVILRTSADPDPAHRPGNRSSAPGKDMTLRTYVLSWGTPEFLEALDDHELRTPGRYGTCPHSVNHQRCPVRSYNELRNMVTHLENERDIAFDQQNFSMVLFTAERHFDHFPDGTIRGTFLQALSSSGDDSDFNARIAEAWLQHPDVLDGINDTEMMVEPSLPAHRQTPTRLAIWRARFDVAFVYFMHGVDLQRELPLIICCAQKIGPYHGHGRERPVQKAYAMELVREICHKWPSALDETVSNESNTCLHAAAHFLDTESISTLLAVGADPLALDRSGWSAVGVALWSSHQYLPRAPERTKIALREIALGTLAAAFPGVSLQWSFESFISPQMALRLAGFHIVVGTNPAIWKFGPHSCQITRDQAMGYCRLKLTMNAPVLANEDTRRMEHLINARASIRRAAWFEGPDVYYLGFSCTRRRWKTMIFLFFKELSQLAEAVLFILASNVRCRKGSSTAEVYEILRSN